MTEGDRLADVLSPVRDLYVAELLEAMAAALGERADVDAEPVDRDDDGRILRHPPLSLPARFDLGVGRGRGAELRRVRGRGLLGFEPTVFDLGAGPVHVAPFAWDAAPVALARGPSAPDWTPLRRWFLEWFQARFGEESPDLLGVVHRLDGPRDAPGGWRLTVDLGSASVAGFAAMGAALRAGGFADVRIGGEAAVAV